MLTDSLGKPVGWIQDLIRDLIGKVINELHHILYNMFKIKLSHKILQPILSLVLKS